MAQWRSLRGQWRLGLKSIFTWGMVLLIAENLPTHRGCGDDPDLSIILAQTVKNPNEIERGYTLDEEEIVSGYSQSG
jgi:hypothetical protein